MLWISCGPGTELLDLDIKFWSLVRVKDWLYLSGEVNFIMFFSSLSWIDLNNFFVDDTQAKFLQSGWLYVFVFPWERWFIGLLMFLFVIFFIKSQIIFGLVLEFIFKVKILQEDLLASLLFVFVQIFWWQVCFWIYWILGIVLLVKVLAKCIMGSSWFVFDSEISVVRQFFVGLPVCFFLNSIIGVFIVVLSFFIV